MVDDRQLRSLFQLVDRDKSGFISRHELSQLFHSLHLQVSQVDVDLLIQSCDSNDDGEIDWHEFLQVMHTHSRQQQRGGDKTRDREREELLEALRAFEGPAPIDGRQPLQTEPHSQPSSGRRGLEVVGPRAGVLNVAMLDTAMELFPPGHGDAARDAKYRRMRRCSNTCRSTAQAASTTTRQSTAAQGRRSCEEAKEAAHVLTTIRPPLLCAGAAAAERSMTPSRGIQPALKHTAEAHSPAAG